MKIAVISDIHGNLDALETVLANIDENSCEKIFCLGDVVGYGANPLECIEVLRERNIPTIQGNHDQAASSDDELFNFNPVAAHAIAWTREQLTFEAKQWLRSLPFDTIEESLGISFSHANLHDPQGWKYVFDTERATQSLLEQKTTAGFIGHTHEPAVFKIDSGEFAESERPKDFFVQPGYRYLVNVGSVGQSRDRDPRSCYVIYNTENKSIRFMRVQYPIHMAQAKIRAAGLHRKLADRLAVGN